MIFCADHGLFYMIGSRNDGKKRLKKILQLVVEIYFYAIVIFAILAYKGLAAFFFFNMLRVVFPTLWGKLVYHSLFAVLSFGAIHQSFIKSVVAKEYRRLLLILFLCWSVVPTLTQLDKSWEFSNVDFFLCHVCVWRLLSFTYIWKEKVCKRMECPCGNDLFWHSHRICGTLQLCGD